MIKKCLFSFGLVMMGFAIVFLILEIFFQFLPVSDPLKTVLTDQVIRYTPNRDIQLSRGWDFSLHRPQAHINNTGFVNDQDYDRDTNTPILAVIGDSYVEAFQVNYEESMQGILSKSVGSSHRVYSFGISGAPLSTYLAFADYARENFRPEAMVFVIIGNDFDESLTRYKSALGFHYFESNSKNLALTFYNQCLTGDLRVG